jgi:hypothetical protein
MDYNVNNNSEDEISDKYDIIMDQYVFINTADLLLLNSFRNLRMNKNLDNKTDDEIIKIGISICEKEIRKSGIFLPSGATKHSSVFASVQRECLQCMQ